MTHVSDAMDETTQNAPRDQQNYPENSRMEDYMTVHVIDDTYGEHPEVPRSNTPGVSSNEGGDYQTKDLSLEMPFPQHAAFKRPGGEGLMSPRPPSTLPDRKTLNYAASEQPQPDNLKPQRYDSPMSRHGDRIKHSENRRSTSAQGQYTQNLMPAPYGTTPPLPVSNQRPLSNQSSRASMTHSGRRRTSHQHSHSQLNNSGNGVGCTTCNEKDLTKLANQMSL